MASYVVMATLLAAGMLVSLPVSAEGAADAVTGNYLHRADAPDAQIYGKKVLAREALGDRLQQGWIYVTRPNGTWDYIDLSDPLNGCVNVYEDGKARIGGLIIDGTSSAVGRFVGWEVEDNGEPAAWVDRTVTFRFPFLSDGGRDYFLEWCASGNTEGSDTAFEHYVVRGNLQVHNFDADGD